MRRFWISFAMAAAASAATLEKLTLDSMTSQATEIVRAKVGACSAALRGRLVYTTCSLDVVERWKGAARSNVSVSIPGGVAGGVRQSFPGAPALAPGKEHVFFLWTGPSGVTQLMGLSQGLLSIERAAAGERAVRAPLADRMLDRSGNPVRDDGVDVPVSDLRKRVSGGTK